jgi:hypothetical protein
MASFDDEVLQQSLLSLNAERMRAQAIYSEAQAEGDAYTGRQAAAEMAEIDARTERMVKLHRNTRPQPQQQPVEETPEQQRVKPLKDWRDAARICGVTEEQYIKGFREAQNAGKLGEFRRNEDQ